jgi:DNA-binding response OmpR family regulator
MSRMLDQEPEVLNNDVEKEFYNYSILIVEDDETIRTNYVTFLKNYFKTVFEASDGELAYELYKLKKPDIILIDIELPKLNGLRLLAKIRENDHTIKAVVITAYSSEDYLLQATELKLTKYLVKPTSRKALKSALASCISELTKFETVSKEIITLRESFTWNNKTYELFSENKKVHLTKKETSLLILLFSNLSTVHFYDRIIFRLWEYPEDDKKDSLKTLVKNLRKKLPINSIENIFDSGYRIRVN